MLWFFIWVVFSTFILGVFFWSLQILLQQKKAWKAYAAKMNLSYAPGDKLMMPPAVSGKIKNFPVSIFTAQQTTQDVRGQRFSTVIEIALGSGLPDSGVVGTEGVRSLIDTLDMKYSYAPTDPGWVNTWIVKTRNPAMMERYMTPARLEVLKRIFKMKILSALYIFDREESVFRIETADPLSNPEKLEKIMSGLIQQMGVLKAGKEEFDVLARIVPGVGDQNPPAAAAEQEPGSQAPQAEEPQAEAAGAEAPPPGEPGQATE